MITALESSDNSQGHWGAKVYFSVRIFAIDSAVIKIKNNVWLLWRLPKLCNLSSQGNNPIKLTYCNETMKRALG